MKTTLFIIGFMLVGFIAHAEFQIYSTKQEKTVMTSAIPCQIDYVLLHNELQITSNCGTVMLNTSANNIIVNNKQYDSK